MKLVIKNVGEFDIQETLETVSLNDLYYLKVKTKNEEFPQGVSMKALGESMDRFTKLDEEQILDDAEALMTLRSLVFLCRRHVGERVTLDSANTFPLKDFAFDTSDDEDDEAEQARLEALAADPTQRPAGSAPAGASDPGAATT